jgi:hypothetical protein
MTNHNRGTLLAVFLNTVLLVMLPEDGTCVPKHVGVKNFMTEFYHGAFCW